MNVAARPPALSAVEWVSAAALAAHIPATPSSDQALQTAVAKATPAVVSIVESKEVPKLEVTYQNPFGNDPFFGGFGIQAAASGASRVVMIDRSQPALDLAARSAALNGVAECCSFMRAYAFDAMESFAVGGERFDVVIADPPAFVKSRKDLASGARGYRKMVRLAAPLVAPGGMLFAALALAPWATAAALRQATE